MLTFEQIKQQYSSNIQVFERGILREYLQYLILSIIFSHPTANKLSFLGGTALRIVYGLQRFSEDIDFDNKDLSINEFTDLSNFVKRELEKEGFVIEIKIIEKMSFHCHIKFPRLLFNQELSSLIDEKLKISVDTFDQGVNYTPNRYIVDKFEIFKQILVTPKDVILSQKLWTITQRKRAKGRDFFDIMSLASQTKPDKSFLEAKFGTSESNNILKIIQDHIKLYNFKDLAEDVAPFLIKPEDVERIKLFPEYLKQLNW